MSIIEWINSEHASVPGDSPEVADLHPRTVQPPYCERKLQRVEMYRQLCDVAIFWQVIFQCA